MFVAVMEVRIVRMPVDEARMLVPVRMRLGPRIRSMLVLVVRIMDMEMLMFHRLVDVLVHMLLGQMQPQADRHQHAAGDEGR